MTRQFAREAMLEARLQFFEARTEALLRIMEARRAEQSFQQAKARYMAAIRECERATYHTDAPALLRRQAE